MKVTELPKEDRPREKAKRYGIDSLSNIELLAIILGSGYKNNNVLQLAANLLSEIGGIKGLKDTSFHQYIKISGIKEAKALMLASMGTLFKRLSSFDDDLEDVSIETIIEKYQILNVKDHQEKVVLVIKDHLHEFSEKTLYIGTEDEVMISYRDIIREVYSHNARGFYLIHTHPSGIAKPSKLDIITTNLLKEKIKRAGLKMIDHYIVGNDSYISIFDYLK